MIRHADIWRAIDVLAERHGLSRSGLARRAGLRSLHSGQPGPALPVEDVVWISRIVWASQ
jgi:hypothetical protein